MEVEREYVLAEPPENLDAHESGRLEQGYLALDPAGAEVASGARARAHADGQDRQGSRPRRGGGHARRGRLRPPVAADRGPRVVKMRYLVPLDGGLTAEVDVYEGDARRVADRRGRVRRRGRRRRLHRSGVDR